MSTFLPMGGFQMPFRQLSRLYNDTKKSSDFVKEPIQNEEDPDIKALHRKLHVQKNRLLNWGLDWSDPNQTTEIDESISKAGFSEVVESTMSTIKDILAEAEPLWLSSKHLVDSSRPTGDRKTPLVKWDKGRFEDLVHDLTQSIDILCDLSRTRSGIPMMTSKLMIKSPASEESQPFESSRYLTPQHIDPQNLTEARPADPRVSPSRSVVFMSKTAYSELTQATGVRLPWAPLLLEYAAIDPIFSATGIMPDMSRFEKLSAVLQQDPQRSPGSWTGLPRLLGYFDDMDNSRLGLVYRFPAPLNAVPSAGDKPTQSPLCSLYSLKDVMCQPESEPPMEVKFRLAHNLANTIFDLHARGISHGNIHESNVSFCIAGPNNTGTPAGQIDLRRPLLSSFDLFPEESEAQTNRLMRHPLDPRSTPTSPVPKTTDERLLELYSLGVVLLSIGLWTRLEDLVPEGSAPSVPDSLLNQLSVRCGSLYMKAVQACWTAVDEKLSGHATSEELLFAVQMKASRYLEACCILDSVSGLEERVNQELQEAASGVRKPSLKHSSTDLPLKDVKSPYVSASDIKPPSRQAALAKQLETNGPESVSTGSPVNQVSKPEGKMKLYPHVPLAPDVVEKWNTVVMPQINQALRGFYVKHPESVEISLESVGPSPQATQPTVLVVCTSVGKVRAILKKRLSDMFDGPSGFALKVCRGQVLRSRRQSKSVMRSMARRNQVLRSNVKDGDDANNEVGAVNPDYQEKPNNGASIGAWIGDRHLPPVSFGGLVVVDGKSYGMTVHHMLDDPDRDFGEGDANRSMANTGSEWFVDSYTHSIVDDDEYAFELSDSESETYSETDITSEYDEDEDCEDEEFSEPGDIPGIEPGLGDGYIVTQPALDDVDPGFFPCSETEDTDHLDKFSLGRVYASSGIRRKTANGLVHEVDWALFRFEDDRQPPDNAIPQATVLSATAYSGELRPTVVAPFDSLAGTDVQCVARSSGLQTGKILPALTSVKIYGRASPSHTYQIASTPNYDKEQSSPEIRPMGIPGDSGAWIVDRNGGQLCGHVLAWSQRKHVAYICPMDVLLQDIAETLEASHVSLPGGQSIDTLRSTKNDCQPSEKDLKDQLAKDFEQLACELTDEEDDGTVAATQPPQNTQRPFTQAQPDSSARNLAPPGSHGSPISGLSSSITNCSLQSGHGIGVIV